MYLHFCHYFHIFIPIFATQIVPRPVLNFAHRKNGQMKINKIYIQTLIGLAESSMERVIHGLEVKTLQARVRGRQGITELVFSIKGDFSKPIKAQFGKFRLDSIGYFFSENKCASPLVPVPYPNFN